MNVLYTDGASRGNPGKAAAGFWAHDAAGNQLVEGSQRLPDCTNNVAEYEALRRGLDALIAAGHVGQPLEVRADSELMIKQLRGEYRVKNPGLQPLFAAVRERLERFPQVKLTAVRRTDNARADALANAAF